MKAYVKPELIFERYELSQHVAACAFDLNSADENVCDFQSDKKGEKIFGVEGVSIFANAGICENTDVDSYCYQANGVNGWTTFNS